MRRRCREPGRRRRIHWVLEAVCVAGTVVVAVVAVAGGASSWVALLLLVVLAAEVVSFAVETAVKARTRHYLEQMERSEGRLAWIEASLWLRSRGDRRDGE